VTRFAGSFKLLVFLILAACSQVQTPNTPTPQVPTVMSTDLSDGAMGVAADAEGNAYVLGYRNAARKTVGSASTGDLVVSRFNVSGRLDWLSRLETSVDYDLFSSRLVVTQDAVYIVLAHQSGRKPFTLYKLTFDGTTLWSKKLFGSGSAIRDIAAPTDGDLLYIVRRNSSDDNVISALDGTGTIVWEVASAPDSFSLEVASDGSLYET
jgi:outer membrane protein assembly factor BamB